MEINIGQTKMEAILGITYHQMANETQLRKYDDVMNPGYDSKIST
ncbi:hypothetical protein C2W59_03521 [Bacillus pumilus]|nr:hypothetical protein C2W59_03521 [Bacillus pumilus]